MMRDKLIDGKKLWVGLKTNKLKWSKMLIVELMIILFHLKVDKFYSIGVMN